MSSTNARLQAAWEAGQIPVLPLPVRRRRALSMPLWVFRLWWNGEPLRRAVNIAHTRVWVETENPDVIDEIRKALEIA